MRPGHRRLPAMRPATGEEELPPGAAAFPPVL